MSEHDAATVARATVWLDTSNEADTRPTSRLDDCETLAFEAPAIEPPTTVFDSAAPDATAVLDRNRAFEAFAGDATAELGATSERRDQLARRRAVAKHVATHALAFALGAAVLALTLQLKSVRASTPALAKRPPAHASVAPQTPAKPAAKPAKSKGAPPQAPAASNAPPPELARAVDALARGDYAAASRMYGELAAARPNDAPLAAVASILASRTRAACSEGSKEPSCER